MTRCLIGDERGFATLRRTPAGHLRAIALRALPRMYRPDRRRFVFRLRPAQGSMLSEGLSSRYTAMVLLGLLREAPEVIADVLHGDGLVAVCDSLLAEVPALRNLGDAALVLWAATALQHPGVCGARERVRQLLVEQQAPATVEVAWALTALSHVSAVAGGELRQQTAQLLLAARDGRSGLFRHATGRGGWLRGHVGCFADQVYPILALAHYAVVSENTEALRVAQCCAERICSLQGTDGQWWWHYDTRTGRVIEGYPVYAVHQDAMAPMALFALEEAGGPPRRAAVQRGLDWLVAPPELGGDSLIDDDAGVIWRKVARHEPRKFVRRCQALVSRLHPVLRVPGVNTLFPPTTIDYECRPYHLGWLLYAWPASRAQGWAT
jgi:hypothetical protein